MTTESLFDALETCLQALDEGADVETCLARYPDLADELHPILDAAIQARAAAVTEVPVDVAQRGRARVLQAAAEMREQQNAAPVSSFARTKRFFGARFYRLAATTAVVIAFLLTGGTGLVNASSGALPGDNLYPVKRGWEGVQLALVFNPQTKSELEHKFDNERVQEIENLYSEKRFEQVNFQGMVETQDANIWRIGGLNIAVKGETVYVGDVRIGATVQVTGETDDGIIKAERIILIAAPGVTPTAILPSTAIPQIIPESTIESGEKLEETQTPGIGEDSGSGESKTIEDLKTPSDQKQSENKDDSGSQDGSSGENNQPSENNDSSGGND